MVWNLINTPTLFSNLLPSAHFFFIKLYCRVSIIFCLGCPYMLHVKASIDIPRLWAFIRSWYSIMPCCFNSNTCFYFMVIFTFFCKDLSFCFLILHAACMDIQDRKNIDFLQYNLNKKKCGESNWLDSTRTIDLASLPPCSKSLLKPIKRCNIMSGIWMRALEDFH